MNIIRFGLMAMIFCISPAQAQSVLRLTLSSAPLPNGKVYVSAPDQSAISMSVLDGSEVMLERRSGTDYRLRGSERSWSWAQVEQVAKNETSITLIPSVDGEVVTVKVRYSTVQADNSATYISTVRGEIGAWISLTGREGDHSDKNSKVYTTEGSSPQMSLKVERQK